jgi:adenylosuccinate synthase
MEQEKELLFEGAQGTFLDIDFGTYPFVTSSSATSGGACIGTGVPPSAIDKVIGVAKAYTTRVGEGPFPTEFSAQFAEFIRKKGKEFGATTGRPRRCGWFDCVMVKEAILINGINELALTKLDVLDGLKSIKIAAGYKYKGKTFRQFPSDIEVLSKAKPVYQELPGWERPSAGIRVFSRLPVNARAYVARLEDALQCPISMVSVGSSRDETIFRSRHS